MSHVIETDPPIIESWGYCRVIINGRDRTWHTHHETGAKVRTVITQPGRQESPMGYGPSALLFQGLDPHDDAPEWLFEGAPVRYEQVDLVDGEWVRKGIKWRGQIDAKRPVTGDKKGFEAILQARLDAAGESLYKPPPGVRKILAEALIAYTLDTTSNGRWSDTRTELDAPTGVKVNPRAFEGNPTEVIEELLALIPGTTVRFEEDQRGPVITEQRSRNTWTFYANAPEVDTTDLLADHSQVLDAIHGHGINSDGGAWGGYVYPDADTDSLGAFFRLPLAHAPSWNRKRYNAAGEILGDNPNWVKGSRCREEDIDFRDAMDYDMAKAWCERELARRQNPVVSGTLVTTADPLEGCRFDIEPDDKIRLIGSDGNVTVFYASALDPNYTTLEQSIVMSTLRGTARDVEDRIKRLRRWSISKHGKPSKQAVLWDSESPAGKIRPTTLVGGQGRVITVPMPTRGEVVWTEAATNGPCEFAFAVFDKPVTVAGVENIIGGNPLEIDGDVTKGQYAALDAAGMLRWYGCKDSPLGYGTEIKPTDEETPVPLTGTFREDGGWKFRLGGERECVWVVMWATANTTLSGRFYPAPVN